MQDILIQINQRLLKLQEALLELDSLEFQYHTMCTINDYNVIQDQKDLIEVLKMKLLAATKLLESA